MASSTSANTKSQEDKDFLFAYLLQQQESYKVIQSDNAAEESRLVHRDEQLQPSVGSMSDFDTSSHDNGLDTDGPGEGSRSTEQEDSRLSAAAGSSQVTSRRHRRFGSQSEVDDSVENSVDLEAASNSIHSNRRNFKQDIVENSSGASVNGYEEHSEVNSEISNNGASYVSESDYHGQDDFFGNIEFRQGNTEEDYAKELQELLRLGSITEQEASNFRENRQKQNKLNQIVKYNDKRDNLQDIGVKPLGFDSDGIPLNWTDDTHVLDSHHDLQFQLVELHPGQVEYDKIHEEFESADLEVVRVDRLQNLYLLDRFKSEMEEVARRRHPGFDLNIRYLYHGTKGEKERVCEEGLDQRLSRMGFFGKGIYFSDNPKKCISYAQDMSGQAYILKCRVILGDSKCYSQYEYDSSLKREPEKENPRPGTWRYYDSVAGCPRDFNEYVVYENRKAMIEYIISFRQKVPDYSTYFPSQAVRLNPSSLYTTPPLLPLTSLSDNTSGSSNNSLDELSYQRKIQEVRERVRQKRCQDQGLPYRPPTEDSLRRDQDTWKRLHKMHTSDETNEQSANLDWKPLPAVNEASSQQRKSQFSDLLSTEDATQGAGNSSGAREPDPVDEVMSEMIHEFVMVTGSESVETAKYYIEKSQMNVNNAIVLYYDDMQ